MKKVSISILLILIVSTMVSCTVGVVNDNEYKPSIMINDTLYWINSGGAVDAISEEFEPIGIIEKIIKSANKLPEQSLQSTAFKDVEKGWTVYGSDIANDVVYIYDKKAIQYIPFLSEATSHEDTENLLISNEKALEDLEYLKYLINNVHPGTIEPLGFPKDELIDGIKDRINEDISNEEFYFMVQEALYNLDDAHTTTNTTDKLRGEQTTKVEYLWLQDGLYIGSDISRLKKGDQILSIGDKTVEYILTNMSKIVSHENLNWVKVSSEVLLNREIYMNYLGIKDEDNRLVYRILRDGKEQLEVIKFEELKGKNFFPSFVNEANNYKILEDAKLGIVEINVCNNDLQYREMLYKFFKSIQEQNIDNIVIDLRKNTGGNSAVIDEFIKYLPVDRYKSFSSYTRVSDEASQQRGYSGMKNSLYYGGGNNEVVTEGKMSGELIFHGNIYLLTSKYTFSSGNWFAVIFKDNDLATIIGEPTGNSPSSFGDILSFTLPNSRINFTMSYKKFIRPNSEVESDSLEPDIMVETRIKDIINGVDPQMEKVKQIIKNSN